MVPEISCLKDATKSQKKRLSLYLSTFFGHTTICTKTGVLENPLPDIESTCNFFCQQLGNEEESVQVFKVLALFYHGFLEP